MFNRKIEKILNEYYENPLNQIIIIDGARQTRKSSTYGNEKTRWWSHFLVVMLHFLMLKCSLDKTNTPF